MNTLSAIENAVTAAYTSPNNNERIQAQAAIAEFEDPEQWRRNIMIIQESVNPYALLFASTNIKTSITKFHNSFSPEDKKEVRDSLLACLSQNQQNWKQITILSSVCTCFARVQKICWFDEKPSELVLQDILPFLENTIGHRVIGLQIMKQLVYEVSTPVSDLSPGEQRQVAVSFRDKCLRDMFTLVITSLQAFDGVAVPESGSDEYILLDATIDLANEVLSFDFIGTAIDSSFDHLGVIHIPSSWSEIIQNPSTLGVFFSLYGKVPAPLSTKILENIGLLSSVRYTILPVSQRDEHLKNLIYAIGNIISNGIGLSVEENVHQLARLLVRFKANYQLKVLVKAPGFEDFFPLSLTLFLLHKGLLTD
eukprot:TRINITY_DN6120_c0_g1_i2.p1 TRINITY_DN6120_c0_g1~~TRINITY_DN6120_c0_g1_i2.p1  ORF type:complete len:366 (-),score=84.32 TRINITY_DN6120_c0_g1_i2:68-1165(-)